MGGGTGAYPLYIPVAVQQSLSFRNPREGCPYCGKPSLGFRLQGSVEFRGLRFRVQDSWCVCVCVEGGG